MGVKYGLDVNVNGICEYINFNDLDKINEKSLLISSNVFFLNKENFKKNINKIMQKHEKKLIISNNYGNKYHNIYGILNKEGRLIRKKTLNGFYFVNDYKTLSFLEDELRKRINMSLINDGVIINNINSVTISKDSKISKGSVIKQTFLPLSQIRISFTHIFFT